MKSKLLFTTALLTLVPYLAIAQTAPESGQSDQASSWRPIETVIVTGKPSTGYNAGQVSTGTRTPTPVEEIPQSIQALTASLIQDQDLQSLPDALANVSNVTPATIFEAVQHAVIGSNQHHRTTLRLGRGKRGIGRCAELPWRGCTAVDHF